jgi:cobalt-zinc-cadmium efflux system outer membrane protein
MPIWPTIAPVLALLIGAPMLAGVSIGASSESGHITLDDAVAIARKSNPDLAAVARELTIASGELVKAEYLGPFNPQIQSEGDYRRRTARSNTQDWRVGLSQEIEVFGQRSLRIKSAKLNLQERRMLLRDQMRLLIGAVKLTYLDALRARDQLKLLLELQGLDSRLLEAARSRLQAGEIGQIDFNLAQVRYGESSRALIEGRERYRLQRSSLGRLLGAAAGPEPWPDDVQIALPNYQLEQLETSAMQNRPDLAARQLEVARLETESTLNRRLALPNLTLGAFGGHELNTEYPMGMQMGFSVPLFNRRQGEAEVIAGQIAQARELLRANQQNVEKQVRDAFNAYQAARESLSLYQQDVAQPAHESFSLLEEAFMAGKIDLLRLSVAEREAFQARMRYFDVWFGANSARVSLELAAGVSS